MTKSQQKQQITIAKQRVAEIPVTQRWAGSKSLRTTFLAVSTLFY